MNIRTILLFLFLVCISILGICQSFRPGYIITNEFDTISGLIKYTGGNKTAKNCLFKISVDSKEVDYKPSDIHGYRLDEGKFFIAREINKHLLFMEFLIQGTANIYYYSDKEGPHYFIETVGSGFVELTEPARIFKTDTGTYQLPPRYPMMLATSMNDFEGVNDRVNDVNLTHNSLINLAKEYHDYVCDSIDCIIFETKLKPLKVNFGLFGSLVFNRLDFGRKVKSGFHPGLEFEAFVTAHNLLISSEKFWFKLGLTVQKQNIFSLKSTSDINDNAIIKYEGIIYYLNPIKDLTYSPNYTYKTQLNVDLNLLYLKIPITINYDFSLGKTRPFFGAGPMAKFILDYNSEFQHYDFIKEYGQSFPQFLLGYNLQFGISHEVGSKGTFIGKLSIEKLISVGGFHKYQRLYSLILGVKLGYAF